MKNRRNFEKTIIALAEMFDKELSSTQLDLYWGALKDLDDEAFNLAANRLARTCKFFPKPVEFRTLACPEPDLEAAAALAFDKLDRAIDRIGSYESVAFDDPVIHAVLESLGGWIRACEWPQDEWKWYRKDFERLYKAYAPRVKELPIPAKFTGRHELDNAERYPERIKPPVLIGDERKALEWTGERKALSEG